VAPGDPYPGHIPGARSAHWQAVSWEPDEHFSPPEEIGSRLAAAGATRAGEGAAGEGAAGDVICYCGSGVQACHLILATQLAGIPEPRLYVGSWSEYSRRVPSRPRRGGGE